MHSKQFKEAIIQNYKYLALFFFVFLLLFTNIYSNRRHLENKTLADDYDGYWHLLRAREIHDTGNWDNEINLRGNAPYGERIHWTHAMDIVLLAGATIGSVFTDFDTALYWFGCFVGPLFYVLSLSAIFFFGRAILGKQKGIYLPLLFAVSVLTIYIYSFAKPDHHCLLNFLFILYYFSFILLLENPDSVKKMILTGIIGAVGMWAGLEIFFIAGLSVLFLGVLWILQPNKYLKANIILNLTLSVGICLGLLLDEKPANYFVISYGKRSILHLTIFTLVTMFWLIVPLLYRLKSNKTLSTRIAIAAGGGIIILSIILCLFPDILKGPMGNVDPRLYSLYLDRTSEFSKSTIYSIYAVFLITPGIIYLLWQMYKNNSKKRPYLCWLILTILTYLTMSMIMNRWIQNLIITSLLPNTMLLLSITKWKNNIRNAIAAFLITVCILIIPLLSPLLFAFNQNPSSEKKERIQYIEYENSLANVLSFLESSDFTNTGDIILANIAIGPAIFYRTYFNAVGTLNHNNDRGIIDTYNIVRAEDDSIAKALIDERGIDYILVDEELKYFAKVKDDGSGMEKDLPEDFFFVDRITNGHLPDWLVNIDLPEELSDIFWLYRVVDDNNKE